VKKLERRVFAELPAAAAQEATTAALRGQSGERVERPPAAAMASREEDEPFFFAPWHQR
jgi:hypothetical protein